MYFGNDPLERLARQQEKLVNAHNRLEMRMTKSDHKAALSFIKELQTKGYEGGKSYTRVVIAAGYASFFALWNALKEDLPTMTTLSSSLVMTCSILIFISSEVLNMIREGLFRLKLDEILEKGYSIEMIGDIKEANYTFGRNSYRIWFSLLIPTILTAVVGACFLLSSFITGIYAELLRELSV